MIKDGSRHAACGVKTHKSKGACSKCRAIADKKRNKKLTPFDKRVRSLCNSLGHYKIRIGRDAMRELLSQPHICPYCSTDVTFDKVSFDHIVPVSRGGPNTMENIQITCKSCNSTKGMLTDEEYKDLLLFLGEKPMKSIVLGRLRAAGFVFSGNR